MRLYKHASQPIVATSRVNLFFSPGLFWNGSEAIVLSCFLTIGNQNLDESLPKYRPLDFLIVMLSVIFGNMKFCCKLFSQVFFVSFSLLVIDPSHVLVLLSKSLP